MAYFTREFITFFRELAVNNNRDWFHANKQRFEKEVKNPFYVFISDVLEMMRKEDPALRIGVKDAVFRINRDIRFSADKSPYKNYVAAAVSRGGRKDMQYPGLYIHLEPGNIMLAGGCYMPDKANLSRLRHYIIDHGDEVSRALDDVEFVNTYGGLAEGEKNKVLPAEFKAFGEVYPLIYNKQFYYYRTYADESFLLRDDFLEFVMHHYRAGMPWNEVIRKALYT